MDYSKEEKLVIETSMRYSYDKFWDAIEKTAGSKGEMNEVHVAIGLILEGVAFHLSTKQLFLGQNYPNPFNPTTNIGVDLLNSSNIKLIIYDINGRQIKELASGYYSKGSYDFLWNSTDDFGGFILLDHQRKNKIESATMVTIVFFKIVTKSLIFPSQIRAHNRSSSPYNNCS